MHHECRITYTTADALTTAVAAAAAAFAFTKIAPNTLTDTTSLSFANEKLYKIQLTLS